jgi:hypothetical protein
MAQQMVDAGRDSGMVVTENHPQLLDDIETVCALAPIAVEQRTAAVTRDFGQGPLEQGALQDASLARGLECLARAGAGAAAGVPEPHHKDEGGPRGRGGRRHEPGTGTCRCGALARLDPRPVADGAPSA